MRSHFNSNVSLGVWWTFITVVIYYLDWNTCYTISNPRYSMSRTANKNQYVPTLISYPGAGFPIDPGRFSIQRNVPQSSVYIRKHRSRYVRIHRIQTELLHRFLQNSNLYKALHTGPTTSRWYNKSSKIFFRSKFHIKYLDQNIVREFQRFWQREVSL